MSACVLSMSNRIWFTNFIADAPPFHSVSDYHKWLTQKLAGYRAEFVQDHTGGHVCFHDTDDLLLFLLKWS